MKVHFRNDKFESSKEKKISFMYEKKFMYEILKFLTCDISF